MATKNSRPAYELPLPDFYNPAKVGEVWQVPYGERMQQAIAWVSRHAIAPASKDGTDGLRIAVMPIGSRTT